MIELFGVQWLSTQQYAVRFGSRLVWKTNSDVAERADTRVFPEFPFSKELWVSAYEMRAAAVLFHRPPANHPLWHTLPCRPKLVLHSDESVKFEIETNLCQTFVF